MADEQAPGWIADEAPHLQSILLELRRLRRGGIRGLQSGRHGVEGLVKLGRSLSGMNDSSKQYEPVLKLFENHLSKRISQTDWDACAIYFDPKGTYNIDPKGIYNKKGVEWRREQTGLRCFGQIYSVFRDATGGEERPFLVRLATAIHAIRNSRESEVDVQSTDLAAPVVDLLSAQTVSGRNLPYWYGDVDKPRLHDVYVPVSLKELDADPNEGDSLHDAIDKHYHLVIVGGPGAGKSTLAVQAVAQIGQEVLTTSSAKWIPLYVPARLLVDSGTFLKALISALNRYLGLYLTATLEESIFSDSSLAGKGWILFIDGIDEIVDTRYRGKLIDQLSSRLKEMNLGDLQFRFVLLTRNIGSSNLAQLKHATVGGYEVAPFNNQQLGTFVESWIRAASADGSQEEDAPVAKARAFLDTAVHLGTLETIRSPLLATLSLITYRGDKQLFPATVADLYESLVACLLFDRQESVKALAQMKRRFEELAGSAGADVADWLYRNRRDICANVAARVLDGDDRPFLVIVDEWIHRRVVDLPYIHDWEHYLESILVDTGLLIRQGADLTLAHREIAMYLAAPIVGLPGDLERWWVWAYWDADEISSQMDETYRNFRMIAWARFYGSEDLISDILSDDEGLRKDGFVLLKELVAWGLPLDLASAREYVDVFLEMHRAERQVTLKYDYALRKETYYPDADYIRLLGILAAQYPDLAELVLAEEYAKYLEPTMDEVGLVSLWKLGNKRFVDKHLNRLMLKFDLHWQVAVVEFYIRMNERDRASAALQRAEEINDSRMPRTLLHELRREINELSNE